MSSSYRSYTQPFFGSIHGFLDIADVILGIPLLPVGAETGSQRIDKRAESRSVVPILREVLDSFVRNLDRIETVHSSPSIESQRGVLQFRWRNLADSFCGSQETMFEKPTFDWIHLRSLSLGVLAFPSSRFSSSPSHMGSEIE